MAEGFGYKWSHPRALEDLLDASSGSRALTLQCEHRDPSEATFRFHAFVQSDAIGPAASWRQVVPADALSTLLIATNFRRYPKINLDLMAPIQLENLLPYNLQYRIYDKDTDQNWRSYLRAGGIMPIHSVELSHLVLLNIEINDTSSQAFV